MGKKIQEILDKKSIENFVGRTEEIDLLSKSLDENGPIVTFVHGIGGIGKSSLLAAFAETVRRNGIPVLILDCHDIEPTRRGFLRALSSATGQYLTSIPEAGLRLAHLGTRVILALDTYEIFRLMDSWLRKAFIPGLNTSTRVFIFGREPPVAAWHINPGWQSLFRSVHLKPLDANATRMLLASYNLSDEAITRIQQFAHGHPLALKLAAAAVAERPDLRFQEVSSRKIIPHLTKLYLQDVPDPITQQALEKVSVLRRVTRSLIAAVIPDGAPQDICDRLAQLPFVRAGSDGLIVHDSIRQVIADNLKASDPTKYRAYRHAAYRQLRRELRTSNPDDIWRYTADLLYMIEEPIIREAFFPTDVQQNAVEPADPADWPQILEITRNHEGSEAVSLTQELWANLPEAFRAIRGPGGVLDGYYTVFDPQSIPADRYLFDPIIQKWVMHLQDDPIPADQRVIFVRRWLGAADGELPSPAQAACWLDLKGIYMFMRQQLRRIYCLAINADVYGPVLVRLGFKLIPEAAVALDGSIYNTAMLDFGPQSVMGWLDGHVRAALNVGEEILDYAARELIVNDQRIGLTPLEFGVLAYLHENEGKAVTRTELLNHVWGYTYEGGSNVVDARVRSLRKKLGQHSELLETVTGVGYRFRKG